MTSNDKQYITIELFNSKMETYTARVELGNERLRNELNTKIDNMDRKLTDKITDFQTQGKSQFAELHSDIQVLIARMDGLSERMGDLQNSVSWGFTLTAAIITITGVVISAAIAFAPSIWAFIERKRKPDIERKDIETIAAEQVQKSLTAYLSGHVN